MEYLLALFAMVLLPTKQTESRFTIHRDQLYLDEWLRGAKGYGSHQIKNKQAVLGSS